MFNVFPLGKLLDPFIGALQNEADQELNSTLSTFDKMGLADSVQVFFDKRKVPHIYAKNLDDLYFTQGYVTAYLRLWQMDFLSYASAGRLSEIFSKGFLAYDREQRRLGILSAAKRSLELIEKDPETNRVLTAYTKGINAYISRLDYKTFPFEYKLLDYGPEPWSNLKTVLIMKYMASTLSGYEEDFSMSNMMLALGERNFNKYFPDYTSHITPFTNRPGKEPDSPLSIIRKPDYLDYSFLSSGLPVSDSFYNPRLGSNSWVISGKKTKSGFPILCNDPHLNLSLPAIWMEMQLSAPGMDVYGVSIPGTPAIIIGFNENIAWGITNGADDVKDWYKLKITDDYKKYKFDGKWLDLNFAVEEIKRKDQQPFYDTIYHAVQGPVVSDRRFAGKLPGLKNYALRWQLHNASNEFLTFIRLNQAADYGGYRKAIRSFSCPSLNFTFACKEDTIAVTHQGSLAVKELGEGKFLLDGTKSSFLYKEYIPADSLPQVINPACNYVLSANNRPTNASYKYYYNGYYSEVRAERIRQMLDSGNSFDLEKMENMQLDNTNAFAVEALPVLVKYMEHKDKSPELEIALDSLRNWKGTYNAGDESARLFELWWKNITLSTWDEFKEFPFKVRFPDQYVLLDLIRKDPDNECFDRQGTSEKETAGDIIYAAFITAVREYDKIKKGRGVKWGDHNKVNLMHLTKINALSDVDLPSAGFPEAINAISSDWGPSWRMIVELGKRPRAFGIYAGGQSGNIGSPYYDNFVKEWNKGGYYPLEFYLSEKEAREGATNTWQLK